MQVIGQGTGVRDASTMHAPFTLSPTHFPAYDFHRAESIMPRFSSLVHAVSLDLEYLDTTLEATAQWDTFTRDLLDLLKRTQAARMQNGSPITLGMHRSDYMLDEGSGEMLQVCGSVLPPPVAFELWLRIFEFLCRWS